MDHLIVLLLVGLVAGFAASHLVAGHGFGLIGDIVVGVIGALLGFFLAGVVGIATVTLVGEIVVAFIGAVILLAVLRLFTMRRGNWGRRRVL